MRSSTGPVLAVVTGAITTSTVCNGYQLEIEFYGRHGQLGEAACVHQWSELDQLPKRKLASRIVAVCRSCRPTSGQRPTARSR